MAIDLRLRFPGRSLERARHALPARALSAMRGVVTMVLRSREVKKQRRALLGLSDQMLKDIGISRADAVREAARPFWDTEVESWRGWRGSRQNRPVPAFLRRFRPPAPDRPARR